jgi:hypothetical protein
LRVQVKSSSYRRGDGYCCQLLPNHVKKRDYSLEQIDLFAAYVIPVSAWYLIPASLVLGVRRITCVMLSPVVGPYGWGEESGFGAEGLPQRLKPEFIGGGYGTTEVVLLPNFHCSRFRVLPISYGCLVP